MKTRYASAVAALALAVASGAALADGVVVRPVAGLGFTSGGDKVAEVQYVNGDKARVHAGGLFAITGGVELGFSPLVSAQALVGYHVDRSGGENGSVRFERFPIELLGHYRLTDMIRIGGGARYINGAKTRSSGAATDQLRATGQIAQEDFKPSVGSVVEAEISAYRGLAIKLRYVSEKFKSKSYPSLTSVDGSHVGVYAMYYFN